MSTLSGPQEYFDEWRREMTKEIDWTKPVEVTWGRWVRRVKWLPAKKLDDKYFAFSYQGAWTVCALDDTPEFRNVPETLVLYVYRHRSDKIIATKGYELEQHDPDITLIARLEYKEGDGL